MPRPHAFVVLPMALAIAERSILTGSNVSCRYSAASTHRRRSRDLLKGFGVTSGNVLASEKERITRSKGGYDEITRPTESR